MRTAFIVVFSAVAGILGGMEIGWRQHAAVAERPIVLTKTCPIPAQTTRWVCDVVELREYRNVCLRRMKRTGE